MKKANFTNRFFAYVIDHAMLILIILVVYFIIGYLPHLEEVTQSSFMRFSYEITDIALLASLPFIQFLYFGHYWNQCGQSPGMKWVGIKVIRRQDDKQISFWRAGFRASIGYSISALLFHLGFIWAVIDKNKEAWHDKLFDTWVVTFSPD